MPFYEVKISKQRGGVPFKIVSPEAILKLPIPCDEGGFSTTRHSTTKKCAYCKTDFKATHKRMKYCEKIGVDHKDQCRSKATMEKRRKHRHLLPLVKCVFSGCENMFHPKRKGHTLCNAPCNFTMLDQQRKLKKVCKCKFCKKDFIATRRNKDVYCGEPCTYVIHRSFLKKAKTLAKYKNQKCRVCEKRIVGANRTIFTCNDPCKMNRSVRKMIRGGL